MNIPQFSPQSLKISVIVTRKIFDDKGTLVSTTSLREKMSLEDLESFVIGQTGPIVMSYDTLNDCLMLTVKMNLNSKSLVEI